MRKFNYISLVIFLIFLMAYPNSISAKEKGNKTRNSLSKTATNPASSVLDINGITTWVGSDGFHDWVVAGSWNGSYPKGSNIGAIFAEGIVWGGIVNDGQSPKIRVDGNTYGTGCLSVFDPPRVYRVRPDYKTGSLNDDAANFNSIGLGQVTDGDVSTLRQQYETDWNEWPADKGAPYEDVNGDGTYEPDVDIPGIPGAAQTLFVEYTDALSSQNYGSAPIGLQISETYWAYAYTGALGNVIYKKVDMIYKGTAKSSASATIDSMYIVQWADPDVGTSSDDFAGCDTSINLGYAYNASTTDATYQAAGYGTPAIGYDFLQGVSKFTGNASDSAIFNLKWRKGYKYINPKPMSSFIYFAAGGHWGDPSFDYTGTLEFYNLMRGKKPDPPYPSGDGFPDGVQDVTPYGTYLLTGDPVKQTGKLDGNSAAGGDSPGDRRIMVVNGPISMSIGDTAEVVLAMVGGLGKDNLAAVTQMKNNDITAQIVFDQLFQLPSLPPPVVHVEQLDREIVLDWGGDASVVDKIENFSGQGYAFEGYEVYQLPSASSSLSDGVNIGTFDLANGITTIVDTVEKAGVLLGQIVVEGTDNGLKRYLSISKDALRGNKPLANGQEYYFAVVPYAFNPAPLLPFHALQSSVIIKVGIPQTTLPGVRYGSTTGDTVMVSHWVTSGSVSDGSALGIVIDPSQTTGDVYQVFFDTTGGVTTWGVKDSTTGIVKVSGVSNQAGGDLYPIIDGIQIKVLGPQPDFKDFQEVSNANGPHDPTYASFTFNGSGFPSSFPSTVDRPTADPAGATWGIQTGSNGTDFDYAYFRSRVLRNADGSRFIPYDYELRFTAAGGKAYLAFTDGSNVSVPFEIWNIGIATPNDPSDDYRMIPFVLDNQENGVFDFDGTDNPISGGDNDPETDWIYWYQPVDKSPGSAGYDAYVNKLAAGDTTGALDEIGDEVMARLVLVSMNAGSVSDPTFPANIAEQLPATGTTYRLISTKPNSVTDVFSFKAPTNSSGADLAKADVAKINVFPNPYYGFQDRETSRDVKYITFSHLPDQATIRIFDLSGVLVKTINKSSQQQFITWNLQNDSGYPVASGIYVAYVDMPSLGTTKVLKLAIVQEEQILKVY